MVCFSFLQNICFQLRIIKQWYKFLILFLFSCNTSEHYLLPSHVTRGHQLKGILEFAALRFLPFFRWKKFHIVVLWGQQILTYTLVSIYWLRNIRFVQEQSRPYCIRPRWSTRPCNFLRNFSDAGIFAEFSSVENWFLRCYVWATNLLRFTCYIQLSYSTPYLVEKTR